MANARVALVSPEFNGSFDGAPLNLLLLAGALEEAGHEVTVHDFAPSADSAPTAAASRILAENPDIVGISTTSPSLAEGVDLAHELRRRERDLVLVKGGPHEQFGEARDACELLTGGAVWTFDYVVSARAGERHMVAIANGCASGDHAPPTPTMHRNNGGVARLAHDANLPIVSDHVTPARHLIADWERYRYGGIFGDALATQLLTYRGCKFACSFCAIPSDIRVHDLATVRAEIEEIRRAGYQAVFLDDGTFTSDWERAREVCDALHSAGLIWACQTRVDQVTDERLAHMSRTGCVYIYFGLESGSERVLRSIRKPQRRDRVIAMTQAARRHGMQVVTSCIFGVPLPGEPEGLDDWRATVQLIQAARPDAVVPSIFAYYPGSPAWSTRPRPRRGQYLRRVGREAIWSWFDDGFGAVHHVEPPRAEEIRDFLRAHLSEFLWAGLDGESSVGLA